jgi:hypothetical protein
MLSRFPDALRRSGVRFLGISFPLEAWVFVTAGLPPRLRCAPPVLPRAHQVPDIRTSW